MMRMFRSAVALLALLLAVPAGAAIVDRIAATVDREVITLSEIDQFEALRLIPRKPGEADGEYRRRILDSLIAQALRYRDVQRFGAEDISADAIEASYREVIARFATPGDFEQALLKAELTTDEVKALLKRQLQVDAYIAERVSPLIFISPGEIETYYNEEWVPQRRARGLEIQPLTAVREEIRALLKQKRLGDDIEKWTAQLRARSNVDIYAYR